MSQGRGAQRRRAVHNGGASRPANRALRGLCFDSVAWYCGGIGTPKFGSVEIPTISDKKARH